MSENPAMNIRLPPDLDKQVAGIARALHRPKSWVIKRATEDFVAVQAWHLAAIDKGLRDADAGRVVAHHDVAAWVRSWAKPDELPMPECE